MAKLFKEKIIKQRLENFEIVDMQAKLETLSSWYKVSQTGNLKEKSEKEVEQSFAEHILGSVLGYTAYGSDDIYTREAQPKAESTGQKADFGLGFFDATGKENSLLKVVMEVKDARTPLDKPQQREGSLTPVQQGFKYKPFFKSCDFVIVSNFIETRLFYDNYSDYEVWTLADLVNPKDNYYNFRKFYFLLCRENLIARRGESTTKKLLSDIRIEQESITKKFYKDYSELRKELYRDLLRNNADENKKISKEKAALLLEKAQKIIDRLIFIHFCEDLDLLPHGKLKENVLRAEEIGFSPWEMLKKFFEFVNSGSKNLGIPEGYNGGLFHADSDLDTLKVGDDICKKFIDLGRYDFQDDLSVNILGHIFEQSISDIEDLKEKIQRNTELDTKVSKRKKDGIFYTPEYIVDYIVKNSVGKKIEDWENELKQLHNFREDLTDKNYEKRAILVYEALLEKVQQIKVLDPACGSGAFLVKVFDFLLAKNKEISEKIREFKGEKNLGLFQSDSHFKSILQNNIYGVDLNDESVEITKLSLWLKTASKGKKLANLDKNIKCGNSLIDDPAVAGDKTFSWEKEFSEIFAEGGFDVIVGNPPYVNIANIGDENTRKFLQKKYKTVKNKSDLYSIFVEKSVSILQNKGLLGMIFSDSWLSTDSFTEFRKFLIEETKISHIIDLPNGIFIDAVVKTVMIFLEKQKIIDNDILISKGQNGYFEQQEYSISYKNILLDEGMKFNLKKQIKLSSKVEKLGKIGKFSLGIKTSDDTKFISNEIIDNNSYKIIRGRDTFRYSYSYGGEYVWYKPELMMLKMGAGPRNLNDFLKEKLIFKEIGKSVQCVFDDTGILGNDTINIMFDINKDFHIKFLLLILNSKFIYYWYQNNFSSGLHIKVNQLKQIPIPNIPLLEQTQFIEKADFMLEYNKLLQEKAGKFLGRVSGTFAIVKLSRKLENFWELSFVDFVKELEKLKVKLSLKDQDEWEEYFLSYKKEVSELKAEIDACDTQIDEMVFDLYGLTQEEREVVLKS